MATPIPQNRAEATVGWIAAATGGSIVRIAGDGARAVGVTSDSRAVVPGCAFVALRGERIDGHDFAGGAAAAGAAVVVVEKGRGSDVLGADLVEVSDTLVAWGDLARAHLRRWRRSQSESEPGRVVAITGSAGKTTTKELCAALLREVGGCHATLGNLNNRIGVPAVVFGLEPLHRFAVVEAGMSVRGEIAELAAVLEADVAIVTNVGLAHAEGVGGTAKDVAREKGDLYAALQPEGIAVVNADDELAKAELARSRARRAETFGKSEGARYRLVARAPSGADGSRFTLTRPENPRDASSASRSLELTLPLVGEAAVLDFLAALAAAEAAYGGSIAEPAISRALASLRPVAGRAALHQLSDGTVVLDDTYNANPASMRAALLTLAEVGAGRRLVAVLGEMRELGASAPAEHEALGDDLVRAGLALAIGCGGLIDVALDRAARGGLAIAKARDTDEAARLALAHTNAGDAVLVKGSRSVGAERVVVALMSSHGKTKR